MINQYSGEGTKWTVLFNKVVVELMDDIREQSVQCCKDNYVGSFKINKDIIDGVLWFSRNLRDKKSSEIIITKEKLKDIKKNEEKIIVIVLESPHIDEYDRTKSSVVPAPAIGKTGDNLNDYFINIIKEYMGDGTYHVILMNAIQYQCSLGLNTNKYRDRVWLKLWICEGFGKNFIKRLDTYKPDIIFNFCTDGSHGKDPFAPKGAKSSINKKYVDSICGSEAQFLNIGKKITLQELTQETINEYVKDKSIICFKGSHPYSWFEEQNRKIEYINQDLI